MQLGEEDLFYNIHVRFNQLWNYLKIFKKDIIINHKNLKLNKTL